jgi:hypothetical protein
MLAFQDIREATMKASTNRYQKLTTEEFKEMDDLRKEISASPSSVLPEEQERFTQLLVRSLSSLMSNSM